MSLRTVSTVIACLAFVAWFWQRGERFIAANGPTFDEPAHLAAGYAYWTAGAFKLNPEHPPLLKLLWSFPLLFTDAPEYPISVAETSNLNHWKVGSAWLFESGVPPRALLDPARRVNLALGSMLVLLVAWVCYRVWRSHLGAVAGCAFAASEPTLLALSCVLTTDLGVTLFGFLTCYLLWEYVAAPSRGLLIGAGISLGLLLGSKFSAIGILAGLGAAGAIVVWRGGSVAIPGKAEARGFGPALELALRVGVIAIVTVAATYVFIHFPQWAQGLRFQLTRGSHGDGVMYLNGEVARTGWYYYFLVALTLKLSLGLLAAAGAASVWRLISVRPELRSVFLTVPPLVFLALASYSRVNIGVRVVLPVLPFLVVLAAGLAALGCCRVLRVSVLTGLVAWCLYAAERASPHEISYFNEIAGGPVGGARYLADSNLDWGQGLPQLKEWMDRETVEAVYLTYFGTDHAESYGLRYQALPGYGRVEHPCGQIIPRNAPRHVVVVSANLLLGMFLNEPESYAWLRERPPTAVLGGSLYVFDLTSDAAAIERVRVLAAK
jgi:hypothetical protein